MCFICHNHIHIYPFLSLCIFLPLSHCLLLTLLVSLFLLFFCLSFQCVAALRGTDSVTDARARMLDTLAASSSAFAALQTDAIALRSQLFAEVKSLAQRISAAEEALTEARKREAAALGTHALISKNTNSNHDNEHLCYPNKQTKSASCISVIHAILME
jgi:hypothetical protein